MSLRWKIALALAALSVVATLAIGTVSYRSTRDRLLSEVDRSLLELERAIVEGRLGREPLPGRGPLSGYDAQVVTVDGRVVESTFPEPLPVTAADTELIGHFRATRIATVDTDAGSYRVRTVGLQRGAVQVGRSLAETDRILDSLQRRILVWSMIVGAAAIALGWMIASSVTASLRRLTRAPEHVESTGQLDVDTGEAGRDEVGRLTTAFDRMLAALARSKDDQRRLVQDAGHELRTPLTSLRTNLDTLDRYPDLSAADRDAIVADLRAETEELTDLVNEIVAVASGETSDEAFVPFDLAELVSDVAARYERRAGREVRVTSVPSLVTAQRSAVQRAVSCLLDNARKFDPSDEPIDVVVGGGEVLVADRGPGIAADDATRVFDRFYRSDAARTMPGSGLGLAIVREVAERHGGGGFARPRDGCGAEVGFRLGLPSQPPPAEPT
jgi:two-component system sensor histidine kinase MprB